MNVQVDRKWLIGGGIGVALLIVLALAAWQVKSIDIPLVSEGHSVAHARSGSESPPVVKGPNLQRCVTLWDGRSNAGPQSTVSTLEGSYVSVTMSSLYSDKCLITATNPQLNLSAQFLESESGPYAYDQAASGEATTLPASVTRWNASANGEGFLTLNSSPRPVRE
ncbi:MAG: hypothetical protein JWM24_1875 [Solirubrobacterales bacterium]|nr:hypothetical protein [Solirubrobacterales bacterium]